ncbi:MAG: acyltransferase, partial [Planctomycetaceae bacterium]|nr:acyltransferase [Planctomycetaceae bacterium]
MAEPQAVLLKPASLIPPADKSTVVRVSTESSVTSNTLMERGYPKYMPQLDGLRAVAVAAVLVAHWENRFPTVMGMGIGQLGVGLFFVLSGFLITSQLWELGEGTVKTKCSNLWRFWVRRVLRIFPLYYLTVIAGTLFSISGVVEHFGWHLSYLSNVLAWRQGSLESLKSSQHFWSLAVEEQFYLLWPLLVLFLPRRHTLILIVCGIAVAPAWRSGLFVTNSVRFSQLPATLDYLGGGAALAVAAKLRPLAWVSSALALVMCASLTGCILFWGRES